MMHVRILKVVRQDKDTVFFSDICKFKFTRKYGPLQCINNRNSKHVNCQT